jgi:hypothetical protein
MSFSFNPGQQAQAGEPMSGGGLTPPVPQGEPSGAIAVPDSPFLFMQQRGQDMTVGAYVQIILVMVSILAVAVSVTLFAYSTYLTSAINSKKEEIATRDATFKDFPIDEMKRVSLRYSTLDSLLKDYLSVRVPLKMLEDVVEKQVVFDKFKISRDIYTLEYFMTFSVVTTNYRALVQQLDALNLTQYSKVTNKAKTGGLSDLDSKLKVTITAPISANGVLGVLAKNVNFVENKASSSTILPAQSGSVSTSSLDRIIP